jgi:hypothetical protein
MCVHVLGREGVVLYAWSAPGSISVRVFSVAHCKYQTFKLQNPVKLVDVEYFAAWISSYSK